MRNFTTFLLIIWLVSPVWAQNQPPAGNDNESGDGSLTISRIEWDLEGRTRQWVLERLLDLETGLVFSSEADLVAFLLEKQQTLINQRELQTSRITFSRNPDEPGTVTVQVTVQDTWNIIALPYARYDSNEGLLLSVRLRDYNFFGTLQDLRVDLDYEFTEDETNVVTLSSDFSLPFEAWQRRWAMVFKQSLAIEEEDLDIRFGAGLEHYFEWVGLDWTAGIFQEYRYITDDQEDDNDYLTNSFFVRSGIDTPLVLPLLGTVRYSPEINADVNYRFGGISRARRGFSVGFDHELAAGRFNWSGNYREGQTARIGNDNSYNVTTETWDHELNGRITMHRAFLPRTRTNNAGDDEVWPRAGVSGNITSYYLIGGADEDQDDAARFARGILNDRMNGDLGLFLNLDAAVTVWTLRPVFEMQLGTFFDVAYVRDTRGDFHESTGFDRKRDLKFGTGIAVLGFPLFARSLFVRGSYGVDIDLVRDGVSPLDSKAREIFIGLGHYY